MKYYIKCKNKRYEQLYILCQDNSNNTYWDYNHQVKNGMKLFTLPESMTYIHLTEAANKKHYDFFIKVYE